MSIKKTIKKCLPRSIVYTRECKLSESSANKTYAEAEQEINAKFREVFGRDMDWENPTTYNEKVNMAKLYGGSPIKTQLTDKVLAPAWVKEKLGGEDECKFIPLLGVYDSIDEIDFSKLPEKYVLKMNNDSGSVFICDDEHSMTKDVIAKYKYYFQKRNYAYRGYEMHYKDIKPKVMVEKYLGSHIRDYKFLCFDGKVSFCYVNFGLHTINHCRNLYDKDWNLLSFRNKVSIPNTSEAVERPVNYTKMWKLAEKLSKGFDQVRVDFYDIDGEIYFGEMTFTSANGFTKFSDDGKDLEFGKKWKLDMDSIRRRRRKLLSSNARIGD